MQVNTLQVLADPIRFQIVETLRGGEHPVNDIVNRVGIQQSGVSRHLKILQEAGFVQVRPQGQRRLYSLRAEPFQELQGWIEQYRIFWEARLDKFGEALEEKQKSQNPKRKEKSR